MALNIGQKWQVYSYAEIKDAVPQPGELVCVTDTPDFPAEVIELIGNGVNAVTELYSAWRNRFYTQAEIDNRINAKQDRISATGAGNLLTAPAAAGGQPGAKPVSDFIPASAKAAPNGVAALDGDAKIYPEQLPDIPFDTSSLAPLDSPSFTGVPTVPGKATAAANDGALIATEAQVYLKADIDSPALTGIPTAPTAPAKTNNAQVATTAYADRAGHPVGSCYTQYPETGQSTIANMFPSAKSPATLFGGTWTERYASEDVFFRTGALGTRRGQIWNDTAKAYTTTGATLGIEPDAVRNIQGGAIKGLGDSTVANGAFRFQYFGTYLFSGSSYSGYDITFDASYSVPTDTTNHPKNRLIKVWERTA
jgi:hypothetical protein